jgi:hypothetical protein
MRMKICMRIAARMSRSEGTLAEVDYQKIMKAIRHPSQVTADGTQVDLLQEIESHVTKSMGCQGLAINWDGVIQWFKDHWLDILQIILKLLPLFFLEPNPEEDIDDDS